MLFGKSKYFRHQVTKFVMLFVERAGSTYLATSLNSHPDILALREKYAVLREQGKSAEEQLDWVDGFFSPPLLGRNKAIGFKTKVVDILDRDGFAKLLQTKKTKVIQLTRKNSIKGVVSTVNAKRLWEKTGNWNLLNESNRTTNFSIDPVVFEELLKQREEWDRELNEYVSSLHLPTLSLYYEELLHDENEFLTRVFDFLQVKPRSVQSQTIKHTRDNLREVVTNFDELRAIYSGTSYEAMFDEVIGE